MPNSIMRLAKKLEYNGFSELKILINKENEETGNLIVPINVKKTLELLDYKVLNIVSNKLKYSKTVYFLGVGDSLYYCEMMAQNLNCIEKSSAYCRNYHDIAYHCEHCDKNDILFFISASGENERLNLYAKQASQNESLMLEESLLHINEIFKKQLSIDLNGLPKTGCAGGISGALYLLNAKLESGIELVLKLVDFKTKLKNIDLVITGEGSTDSQTMYGKTISGIARLCKENDVGVIVISGRIKDADNLYNVGVSAMFSILNEVMDLKKAMNNGFELLKKQAENIGRLINII